MEMLRGSDCIGVILLGTELTESAGKTFVSLRMPIVILDSYFDSLNCNYVDSGAALADCYFADNDLIAVGAIKALRLRGYRIPEDIAIIGFDNISEGRIIDPSLTSVSIPRLYMAQLAVKKLIDSIHTPVPYTSKIEVSTSLVKRFSV